MKIPFDQGTPVPLRKALPEHAVSTAWEMGWARLTNGEFLRASEASGFEVLVTTDGNLRHQQNLGGRSLGIIVLPTTNWATIQSHTDRVVAAVSGAVPGEIHDVEFGGDSPRARPPHLP